MWWLVDFFYYSLYSLLLQINKTTQKKLFFLLSWLFPSFPFLLKMFFSFFFNRGERGSVVVKVGGGRGKVSRVGPVRVGVGIIGGVVVVVGVAGGEVIIGDNLKIN